MSDLLLAKLSALREKVKAEDPCPRSDSRQQSTLATFLLLYSRADSECYIDYMQGAKDLLAWLTSNGSIPLLIPVEKYPEIENPKFIVPRLLGGYETGELAKIIAGNKDSDIARMRRAIYFVMTKEVIYEMH